MGEKEYSIEIKQVKFGRYVSIITFHNGISDAEKKLVAKMLKRKLGAGGTVKNGKIIIQGRHRRLEQILPEILAKIHT